jgi:hypothetical protein
MSDLKTFLKALQRSNYPKSEISVHKIAQAVGYDLKNFLSDLHETLGKEKTEEFIQNVFYKLGASYDPGVEIDLSGDVGYPGSYIFLTIKGFDVIWDEDEVWIHYSFGANELFVDTGDEDEDEDGGVVGKTLDEIYDDVDMGGLGEFNELLDEIQDAVINSIYKKTGFIIHFDSQI